MNTATLHQVENKTARTFISFIEEFRKLNKEMQANQIALFLHVAAQPDLTIREYSQRADLGDGGTITRNLDALSETRKINVKDPETGKLVPKLVDGYGLIDLYEDAMDRRFKRVKLTARGVRVYNSLVQLLGS
ncbi:hypothetical protein [Mesorhizobium sp. M7A.F.Ca.CA.004.02.1.1]|uniref:hypothetical protein n=1 Tax=Mesorhizobium sp. M7A.F.Ca.CA.004.02.1.1 TaxID=2496690 RepID=UPI000FCB599B|nr:hypothetical protein [Mesorhizobium sp. M7A.F.Ca.CA.004.02.1.1]RVB05669.1 hypothetical protein EN912_02080 [Mesorhizobium sp. M7A.F.Ca.CA.004.02.1.1]